MHILRKKTDKKNTKKKKLNPVTKDRVGGQNHKPGLIKPRYSRTAREPRESRVGEEEKCIKTEERGEEEEEFDFSYFTGERERTLRVFGHLARFYLNMVSLGFLFLCNLF